MNKLVEHPKPIDIEQHKPIDVKRPIKYIEKVHIPVTEKGSESKLHTNVNDNDNINNVGPVSFNPVDGPQDLSSGYTPHKIQKKA